MTGPQDALMSYLNVVNTSVNIRTMKTKSKTISFRLDTNLCDLLDERTALDRTSPGLWVRKLVENELLRPFDAERFDRLLTQLKNNQAQSLYYMLTQVGAMESVDAADLVRSKLLGD